MDFSAAEPGAAAAPPLVSEYGRWGFDSTGANFAIRPGSDFFLHSNGAWLDRTTIPPDRYETGVDTILTEAAEARSRDIIEQGEKGVAEALRADAAKVHVLYSDFMDEARAELLDMTPD